MIEAFWYAEASNGQSYGNFITYEEEDQLDSLFLLGYGLHQTMKELANPDFVIEHIVLQVGSFDDYREGRT